LAAVRSWVTPNCCVSVTTLLAFAEQEQEIVQPSASHGVFGEIGDGVPQRSCLGISLADGPGEHELALAWGGQRLERRVVPLCACVWHTDPIEEGSLELANGRVG